MVSWPDTSWKKHFCAYLIHTDKYFVFPRISLTTNFNDPGTHLKKQDNHEGQVQLKTYTGPYRFKNFDDSNCIYDTVLELIPGCAKRLAPPLAQYDFEFDLYGLKKISDIKTPFVITIKPTRKPIKTYRRALKPQELNVILDNRGEDITLCRAEDILPVGNSHAQKINNFKYYYTIQNLGWKVQIYSYLQRIKRH